MFRKPRFPLSALEKVVIESHLAWIHDHFGEQNLSHCPTLASSSKQLQPLFSEAGILHDRALAWVEQRLPFECASCELIKWDGYAHVPPDPQIILINPMEQNDLAALINRIAIHLTRLYLNTLSRPGLAHTRRDLLSELIPVCCGLGVFSANVSLQTRQYSHGENHYWEHDRLTNTAARHLGVAIAYLVWARGEESLMIARSLRPDARVPFQQALKYLNATGDSCFDPRRGESVFVIDQVAHLQPLLDGASPGTTVAILQRIQQLSRADEFDDNEQQLAFLKPMLPNWFRDQDESIRLLACELAGLFGQVDDQVLDGLKDLLSDPVDEIRETATRNLVLLSPPEHLLPRDLSFSLKDDARGVVVAAIQGLVFLNQREEDLVPSLLNLIRKSFNSVSNGVDLALLLAALETVSDHAERHVQDFLKSDSEELNTALRLIRQWRSRVQQD